MLRDTIGPPLIEGEWQRYNPRAEAYRGDGSLMKGVTLPAETVFVMEMSPIKFGLGATDEIGFDVRRLGLRKVLIVTDPGLAALGIPERVRTRLDEQGIKAEVFDGVQIEPTD